MLFQSLLKHTIQTGSLRLVTADGKVFDYGDGSSPRSTIKLKRKSLEWSLVLNPALRVPEAYMDGTLTVEEGDLRLFLSIVTRNLSRLETHPLLGLLSRLRRLFSHRGQSNSPRRARRNVARHYDLSPRLYDLFLDSDRQYSCAYFRQRGIGLEEAQRDKKRHLLSKLHITRPGLRVLDIGSGWGGLSLYLAQEAGCQTNGITLSVEQLAVSEERAAAKGLSKTCAFRLNDYRLEKGPYDRIVSVGMFEHVGKRNYDTFFEKVRDLLTDDGVCLLHSIGTFGKSENINPFILKHIFPGADIPALSDVLRAVERSGLFVTDVEILRLHYAETLRLWNERFQARREEAVDIYDETFFRKWSFYLAGCEMGFRYGGLMVFQLQLTKKLETLPLTRDYMFEAEAETALSALAREVRESSAAAQKRAAS